MSNNSIKKLLAVSLLSVIGLTACSNDIQAKPKDYDDPLITLTDANDEIYHNLISIIEDAYRDSSLASATLDKVLYQYSISVFGRYNRIAKPYNLGKEEITLKEAAAQCVNGLPGATHDKVDKFIEEHKAYWTTDNDGERKPVEERGNTEYARVWEKWQTIEDRIARHFYDSISGSYKNDRGYFSEKKYLAELKSQLGKVLDPYSVGTVMTDEDDKIVVTSEVQEEKVFETEVDSAKGGTTTYLHRENYQDLESYDLTETEKSLEQVKAKYVEDEVIPTIYRNLLVEQYLLDESYNTLGRSAARKVNVLSISANSNNTIGADYLMKYFVRDVISVKDNIITLEDFKEVGNAVKGLVDNTGHNAYLDALNSVPAYEGAYPRETFTGYDDIDYAYYVGTDYGDMMADYRKINKDINLTDTSVESTFTGTYTHTAQVGKEIKENGIKGNDYVTDGWFIKSNGVGDLPEDIKSRLFNIAVANVLDDDTVTDRFASATYTVPAKENRYVAKINGKYYLKVASKQSSAKPEDDILFYEGGKYYVVQIEEAVSGSKLAKETTLEKYNETKKEEIINEVCRIVAKNDAYKSASTKHWLEEAALKYHDSKVYDYFKENYPDLFED